MKRISFSSYTTIVSKLAVKELAHQVLRNLLLPLVSIGKELFLIIQKFFVGFGRKFVVGTLHNCVYGTSLLAESAINTFGHIDIVTSGSTSSVFTDFGLDGNCLSRANCLAEFARDTTFISCWVSSQGVFTAETRTQITSLKRVVDRHLWFQTDFQGERKPTGHLCNEENLGGSVKDCFPWSRKDVIIVDVGIFSCCRTRCSR
mmetsp:Transcript_1034/g.2402  ORF Transcript_1034/g.2402 Transcript_1034/m.2402 type:complete len:203 (-) Transcript_1034:275-883(-)